MENDMLLCVVCQDCEPRYLRIITDRKVADKCASLLVDKATAYFATARI